MSTPPLEGRTILVVEDEYLQAREAREFLQRAGARVVGPTGRAEEVASILASETLDAAVVDINLGNGLSFEVADSLRDKGVPFMFLTGYDASTIPDSLRVIPMAEKPANENHVIAILDELCGPKLTRSSPEGFD